MNMDIPFETKSEAINQLLLVSDVFCAAGGGSRGALSKHLFDRGGQIDALAAGKRDLQTATFERAMKWLADNWPDGAEWPADVDRPEITAERARKAEAAAMPEAAE